MPRDAVTPPPPPPPRLRIAWLTSHAVRNEVVCNETLRTKPLNSWDYYCALFRALTERPSLSVHQSTTLNYHSSSYSLRKAADVGVLPLECTKSGSFTLLTCLNKIDVCQGDRGGMHSCPNTEPLPIAIFLNKMFKEPLGKLRTIRNHTHAKRIVAIFSVMPPAHLPLHTAVSGVRAFSLPYAADPAIFGSASVAVEHSTSITGHHRFHFPRRTHEMPRIEMSPVYDHACT
uniref:Uncharacterized protein n=1 Tax=Haptolina brevifila TaxID=156173 RepID=A0A7S2MZ66_9EUKA|mmetsp:Transcript_62385/g.123300  ORF Transcript_62385/g.123300 Transcript_62385/m.123300 type:complete len:231 (+) Transcript_62385:100-792(+)